MRPVCGYLFYKSNVGVYFVGIQCIVLNKMVMLPVMSR